MERKTQTTTAAASNMLNAMLLSIARNSLKGFMEKHNCNAEEMADIVEMSESSINQLLRGELVNISTNHFSRIIVATGNSDFVLSVMNNEGSTIEPPKDTAEPDEKDVQTQDKVTIEFADDEDDEPKMSESVRKFLDNLCEMAEKSTSFRSFVNRMCDSPAY